MKLKVALLPRPCRDCGALTRARACGTRYFFENCELYAEKLSAPLCPRCTQRIRWQLPATWLGIIAGRETAAKAALERWMAQAEAAII